VRTWGEVVEAAAELWAAISDRDGDPSMARIDEVATRIHRTQQRTGWPGAGLTDPHLEPITNHLVRAAELVTARRHPTAPLSETGHLDSEAARTRIMHILYVSSHGVSTALNGYTRALQQRLDTRKALAPGDSLPHARDARERIGAVERLAGSYLHAHWPAALFDAHRDPPARASPRPMGPTGPPQPRGPTGRRQLARHRRSPTRLALATSVVTAAAASRGLLAPHQHTDRLRPPWPAWSRPGDSSARTLGR